jgi:hypothetical protein
MYREDEAEARRQEIEGFFENQDDEYDDHAHHNRLHHADKNASTSTQPERKGVTPYKKAPAADTAQWRLEDDVSEAKGGVMKEKSAVH